MCILCVLLVIPETAIAFSQRDTINYMDNRIVIHEEGKEYYIKWGADENGASSSWVYNENNELIEVYKFIPEENKMLIEDIEDSNVKEVDFDGTIDNVMYSGQSFSTSQSARSFCKIGSTKSATPIKISYSSIIAIGGLGMSLYSLTAAAVAASAGEVIISTTVFNKIKSELIAVGIDAGGFIKGGILLKGYKKCYQKRGGRNPYNAYKFVVTSVSTFK